MKWNKEGEIIVRLPADDDQVIELVGIVTDIELNTTRDMQHIYVLGGQPSYTIPSKSQTSFTIRGIATSRNMLQAKENKKIIQSSRWEDIINEDEE